MIHTIADIIGTGATVPLSATSRPARFVLLAAPGTNSADVRVGDSATSISQGVAIAKGTGLPLPGVPESFGQHYNLVGVFAYIANGDKLTISYGD